MTTLTSTSTIAVGDAAVSTETTSIYILPAGVQLGRGRLIHPDIGTYDYLRGPDEWVNIDGDAIIPPAWASTKTLRGAANTVFLGNIRDVVVEERWTQRVAMEVDMARMLVNMWSNPPDPADAYVEWYPTYASEIGFKVVLLNLSVGGNAGITLSPLVRNGVGWVRGPVVLKMRVIDRL